MDLKSQISSLLQEIVAGVREADENTEGFSISLVGGSGTAEGKGETSLDLSIDPYRGGVGVAFKVYVK